MIFAGLISLATLGNYTYFGITQAALDWPDGIWPVLLCGAAGGLGGGLFSRLLLATTRALPGRLGVFAKAHPIRLAAACGLGTALIGLATGGLTYGTGYTESKAALEGISRVALLLRRCQGGHGATGLPERHPRRRVRARARGRCRYRQQHRFVHAGRTRLGTARPFGMVAFLSGMTQSPITSFVLVMEMTANHQFLIPLMAASVIAHGFQIGRADSPLRRDRLRHARKLHPHRATPEHLSDEERLEAELAAEDARAATNSQPCRHQHAGVRNL